MPNLTQGLLAGIQSGPVQLGNAQLPFNMAPYVNSQTQADSIIDQLQAYEDSIEAGEDNMRKLRKMLDPADLSHKVASLGTSSLSQYMFYNSLIKQADKDDSSDTPMSQEDYANTRFYGAIPGNTQGSFKKFIMGNDYDDYLSNRVKSTKQAAPNAPDAGVASSQPAEPIMSVLPEVMSVMPEEPIMSVEPVSSAPTLEAPVAKSQAKTPVKNLPPPPLPVATEKDKKRFQLSGQATREQLRNAVLRELNLKARQGKFTAGSTLYPVGSADKIQAELSRRDAERAGMKQQIGYLRQELGAIDPIATKSMTDYDLEHMIQESRGNVDVGWNELEGRPAGQVGGYSDQSPILSRFRNILNIPNRMFGKSEARMEDLQKGQGNQVSAGTRQAPTPGVYTDSEAKLRSNLDFGEDFQPYNPNIEIVDYGGGIPSLEESKDILVGTRNRLMRNLLRYPGRFIGAGIDRGLDAYDELRLSPEEMAQIRNPSMLQQARSYLGMPVALDRFRTGLKENLSASLGGPGYTYRDILDLDNGPDIDNADLARERATAMGRGLFGDSITPEDAYYYFGDAANALYAPSATSPTRPARPLQLARAALSNNYYNPTLIKTPGGYYSEPAKPTAQPTAQATAQPTAQATAQPTAQPTAQAPSPNPDFRKLNRSYMDKLNPEANQIAQDYIAEFDEDVVLQERYIRLLTNDLEELKSEYPDGTAKPKSVADEIAGIEAALTYMTNIVEAGDLEKRFRDVENTGIGFFGYSTQAERDKAYNEALKAKNENYNRYIGARYNRRPDDVGTFMNSEYMRRNPTPLNNQQPQVPGTKR